MAQLERAMKMIGEGGKPKKTKKNPNDPARFIKVTNATEHGEVAEEAYCTLDLAAIAEKEKYDQTNKTVKDYYISLQRTKVPNNRWLSTILGLFILLGVKDRNLTNCSTLSI